MKTHALIVSSLLSVAFAAPAIVWKSGSSSKLPAVHSADSLKSRDLLVDAFATEATDASLNSVVFLLGKDADGAESLHWLASAGSLPVVADKYDNAQTIYHHVSGIESPQSFGRDADAVAKTTNQRIMAVSLKEYIARVEGNVQPVQVEVAENGVLSKADRYANKRTRELAKADILLVNIDPKTADPVDIDSAVSNAVDSSVIGNVVLAAVRGLQETKHERYVLSQQKMQAMEKNGQKVLDAKRRRLDQQDGDNADGNANDNANNGEDTSGVYFVLMTPNILAGILYIFLFTFITAIGMTCMGAIASQDVYVDKMPAIGREA